MGGGGGHAKVQNPRLFSLRCLKGLGREIEYKYFDENINSSRSKSEPLLVIEILKTSRSDELSSLPFSRGQGKIILRALRSKIKDLSVFSSGPETKDKFTFFIFITLFFKVYSISSLNFTPLNCQHLLEDILVT